MRLKARDLAQPKERGLEGYHEVLSLIRAGRYREASERTHLLRDQASLTNLRKLLSARLALKGGVSIELSLLPDPSKEKDLVLRGELYFVRGLILFQAGEFPRGALEFDLAAQAYKETGWDAKDRLSQFNNLIGESNSIIGSEIEPDWFARLRSLELEARAADDKHLLGLVLRQRAYAFFDSGRMNASLSEIEKAIETLVECDAISDYQLCLLHAAEVSLRLETRKDALTYYEQVVGPIDSRVEFPRAFIGWLLGGDVVQPRGFAHVSPYWRSRWEKSARLQAPETAHKEEVVWTWHPREGKLMDESGQVIHSVGRGGLEANLIETLISGSRTKHELAEKLWPQEAAIQHVDNRLHRLISRFNKSTDRLVQFHGGKYSLKIKVETRI